MKRIIDHKQVEMTDAEFAYFQDLLAEFPDGKHQIRDLFDVDGDGCIVFVRPHVRRQIAWGLLFFFQNLMINQRLRWLEVRFAEATKQLYDLVKEEKDGRQDDTV
jgi:hypothetical protein